MLEAVIFDMDGVIVDTEPGYYYSSREFLRRYGKELTKEVSNRFLGMEPLYLWQHMIDCFHLSLTPKECNDGAEEIRKRMISEEGYQAIPGAVELIKNLYKSGIPLGLASSSPVNLILEVTEILEVRPYFTVMTSGTTCKRSKPDPEIFSKTASDLNVKPENCVVIEDSPNGIQAAKDAGMTVIGFANPQFPGPDLSCADRIVSSIGEITLNMLQKY